MPVTKITVGDAISSPCRTLAFGLAGDKRSCYKNPMGHVGWISWGLGAIYLLVAIFWHLIFTSKQFQEGMEKSPELRHWIGTPILNTLLFAIACFWPVLVIEMFLRAWKTNLKNN